MSITNTHKESYLLTKFKDKVKKLTMIIENTNGNEILHITHGNCTDGAASSLAVDEFYFNLENIENNSFKRIHGVYDRFSNNKPNTKGKHVIITDFSYSREVMEAIAEDAASVMLIDHHVSAQKDIGDLEYCYFDIEHSGGYLTWLIFMGEDVPELIRYIEDRDIWKWKLPYSKEINTGIALLGKDSDVLKVYLHEDMESHHQKGIVVLEYMESLITSKTRKNKVKLVNWGEYKVPLINNSTLISEVGNALAMKHPFSIQYFITKDEIVFSFRSTDAGVDLMTLNFCKGHRNAAGRSIDLEDINLNKLFSLEDVSEYLQSFN